jgi:hypothetical protein
LWFVLIESRVERSFNLPFFLLLVFFGPWAKSLFLKDCVLFICEEIQKNWNRKLDFIIHCGIGPSDKMESM